MGLSAWVRLRWRSVDQERNRDQQGDHDENAIEIDDRLSGMRLRSGWCGAHHVTRDNQGYHDQEVFEIVISDQVCNSNHQCYRHRDQ